MNKKRRLFLLLLILLLCVPAVFPACAEHGKPEIQTDLYSCYPNLAYMGPVPRPFDTEGPEHELEIWFGRISCCDGFVIRCQNETMLIDGGDNNHGAATLAFLNGLGLRHVDYVFNTHHHDDHLGMQKRLLKEGILTCDVFLTPYERGYPVAAQLEMEQLVDRLGIEYRTLHDGDTMMLGGENGALLQFYRWNGSTNANYSSMMCKVTYGERTLFLLADVCSVAQRELAQTRPDINFKSDIIKAGHHGYTGQNSELMKLLDPEACIITNSLMGGIETVHQMERLNIPYYLTNLGTIYLHTDGGGHWYLFQDKTYQNK